MTRTGAREALVVQRDQLRALYEQITDELHAEGDQERWTQLLALNRHVIGAILELNHALREAAGEGAQL